MFDVVAVDMETNVVRLIAENKTDKNAQAIIAFALMKRGGETEFFADVPHGKYKGGETWQVDE